MTVYMVHSESGVYSDHVYNVHGMFSAYEKAKGYVERQAVEVYRMKGTAFNGDYSKPFDVWQDTTSEDDLLWDIAAQRVECEVAETRKIVPTSGDGRTFSYVYPDGNRTDEYWDTFYITGYEVDDLAD